MTLGRLMQERFRDRLRRFRAAQLAAAEARKLAEGQRWEEWLCQRRLSRSTMKRSLCRGCDFRHGDCRCCETASHDRIVSALRRLAGLNLPRQRRRLSHRQLHTFYAGDEPRYTPDSWDNVVRASEEDR